MTFNMQTAGTPTDRADSERPADPRPAWERIAYAWLAREVDAGQPVDPATLAREVSVAPGLARDLVRVLRAERDRDPALEELRGSAGAGPDRRRLPSAGAGRWRAA